MTLDEIIKNLGERMPWRLIEGRAKYRHEKAVDANTGEIIGYARWKLPEDNTLLQWPKAKVPEPSIEERATYEAAFKTVTVAGRAVGLKPPAPRQNSYEAKEAFLEGKQYLCNYQQYQLMEFDWR